MNTNGRPGLPEGERARALLARAETSAKDLRGRLGVIRQILKGVRQEERADLERLLVEESLDDPVGGPSFPMGR